MNFEEFLKALGNKIREIRERDCPDRSLSDLAGHANKNKKAWESIERGESNPELATLNKMALALGVTIDELFKLDSKKRK
jgi:transcriptional regulator with XRE-family HTH domain